ncbi:hypothetical protein FSP39_024485 [Pinctada imbricata]|uniref:Uncharacterized protein n=1 Tax=Pinctada imbricata TaxID=66713 RepID=A0AA88YFP6_PINIB|nr:hypothetical protein FSP39_024485 [Pinctada imbricata]
MATLVSGLTVESVHLFCKSLNLAFSSKANFFGYQRLYGQGIQNFFQAHTDKLKRGIEGKQNVILVDTRYDSPGFCASKATTIFMDLDTKNIVHIEVGHKNECGGSAKLEGFLFEKGLDHLIGMGLQVKEIVTDASRTLISILGACDHPNPVTPPRGCEWLEESSPSYQCLRYTSRNQLAVLDYNHHNDRKHKENSLGDLILSTQCSRKTKEWVAYKELEEKEYSYLPSMFVYLYTMLIKKYNPF